MPADRPSPTPTPQDGTLPRDTAALPPQPSTEVEGVGSGESVPVTERALAGRDHDDFFPWSYGAFVTSEGDPRDHGGISTPNGRRRRPDGTMHTYWLIAGEVWEPTGLLICEAVNAYVKRGWRARLGRWLLGRGEATDDR